MRQNKNLPFIPHELPLEKLDWTSIISYIGTANREIARYDGLLQSIPNPAVLLSPLTTQEAVLSSKIEGTQATLEEVLKFEANMDSNANRYDDIQEVLNYRKAMAFAVKELKERPITLNLIRRTHQVLLDSVRGQNSDRGNFRRIQNWIDKPGSNIEQARFIPPNPLVLQEHLDKFEKYIHYGEKDLLVQLAIIHAQFEILHPFLDGNGRIGRIIIPLFLYEKKVLSHPMFYISGYFEKHRQEYYDHLKAITEDDNWENWIIFFLKATIEQAEKNCSRAKEILTLYEDMKKQIVKQTHSQFSIQTLDCLFNMPIVNSSNFIKHSKIPKPSASRILSQLKEANIIDILQAGKGRKPAVYMFKKLIEIINNQ